MEDFLCWDDSYAIAMALMAKHPVQSLDQVSLGVIYDWTLALPEFHDDPDLANDDILMAIFQEWYEEINPV